MNKIQTGIVSAIVLAAMQGFCAYQSVAVSAWVDGVHDTQANPSYIQMDGTPPGDTMLFVPVGETRTLKAVVPAGHEISKWSYGDSSAAPDGHYATVVTSTADTYSWAGKASPSQVYLAVHFEWLKYTVTFNKNGGTSGTMSAQTDCLYTDTVTLDATTFARTGYEFAGWSLTKDGPVLVDDGGEVTGELLGATYKKKNITLYALWTPITVTVTFDANGGEAVTPATQDFVYDAAYGTLPVPIRHKAGYPTPDGDWRFDGWEKEGSVTVSATDTMRETENFTLTAKWTEKFKVVWQDEDGEEIATKYLVKGARANENAPSSPNRGPYWTFTGWTGGAGSEDTVYQERTYTAQYSSDYYFVQFNGNGETSGKMSEQAIRPENETPLATNAYSRIGYAFGGWSTAANGAKVYDDGAKVKALAQKGQKPELFAVWNANKYTVVFLPNGGQGEMAVQTNTYDKAVGLFPNAYYRMNCAFDGWALDPEKAAAFADEAVVKNLTSESNGVVRLYAKWKAADGEDSPFSAAADCATDVDGDHVALGLTTTNVCCTVISNQTDAAEGTSYIRIQPTKDEGLAELAATLVGAGRLTFKYRLSIAYPEEATAFTLEGAKTVFETRLPESEWKEGFYNKITTNKVEKIKWALGIDPQYADEDNDYVEIDSVKWLPDSRVLSSGAVTFRRNDGTAAPADIVTNMTVLTGSPYAAWPTDPERTGHVFGGWFTDPNAGEEVKKTDEARGEDLTLYARWLPDAAHRVTVPTVATNLVYTGSALTGVASATNLVVTGNVATNAGSYVAIVTPADGFAWADGTTETTNLNWSIAKAKYDLTGVSLTNATYAVDGQAKSLTITGKLPSGVVVSYNGNGKKTVGVYTVTASFTGDTVNHETMAPKTATLTIVKGKYDMSGVKLTSATFDEDGKPKSLAITGTLPSGVTVSYTGNGQTKPGVYTVTASFVGDAVNYEPIAPLTATLTINEVKAPGPEGGLYPDESALTDFEGNATYNGWLRRDGKIAGLITIKAAKANKKTGEVKLTVTATPLGGKKATLKVSGFVGGEKVGTLKVSAESITGTLVVAGVNYEVRAGVDYFKSADKTLKTLAKAKAAARTVTFAVTNATDRLLVSAAVAKGTAKTKFTIYLSDGTKVSVSSQGIFSQGLESLAIPVSYAKKNISLGFVLWIDAEGAAAVSELTEEDVGVVGPHLFVPPSSSFVFGLEELVSPYREDLSPAGTLVTVSGTKWSTPKTSAALKLKCDKNGLVTGSCKLFTGEGDKPKSGSAKIVGVMVGDDLIGTTFIKNKIYLSTWSERD